MSSVSPPAPGRVPVLLVTGFLGSGKTTLLARWLREPLLAKALTVVNEYGEVGLDDRLLATATDRPDLVAGGCVCCTGLAGLAQTLEDLFWARLHRDVEPFSHVVIETTGLADPAPIVQSLHEHPLLRERYALWAVVTTVAAPTGAALLHDHETARAQVRGADVVVLTKTDRSEADETERCTLAVARLRPDVPVMRSAHADLRIDDALAAVRAPMSTPPQRPPEAPEPQAPHGHHDHSASHLDGIASHFIAVPGALDDAGMQAMATHLQATYGAALLRAKGVLLHADGGRRVLQLSPGEPRCDLQPFDVTAGAAASRPGLTVILAEPGAAAHHHDHEPEETRCA